MNPLVKEISKADARKVCQYCNKSEINTLEWGPMYQLGGVTVHYFCMLFSAGLSQNGSDDQGILGFLPVDIKKELKRGEKLKCKYCKLQRATIGCSVKNCKVSYHYPCGLNKNCSFRFIGNFESYCGSHKEPVHIPLPKSDWFCPICFCEITDDEVPLWPPCCKKKVFHKTCIMQMARNHGAHFFKCPLCNDREDFSVAMRMSGVYLPDRDAAWEIEPNAFAEQLQVYSRCDAEDCKCPKGRDHCSKSESRPWKVVRCGACGASGVHKHCGNLKNLTWRCPTCARVLSDKMKHDESINSSRIRRQQFDLSSDEEDGIDEEAPIPVRNVISGIPQVESSTSTTSTSTDSSSEEEQETRNPIPFVVGTRRHIIIDTSDSEDNNSDGSDDNNIFVQPTSKLVQKLDSLSVSNENSAQVVRKSKPTGSLRDVLINMNRIPDSFSTQKSVNEVIVGGKLHSNVEAPCTLHAEEEGWKSTRASFFQNTLNKTIVKCCRQNSSKCIPTPGNLAPDNVSNPIRTDSCRNISPTPDSFSLPPVGKNSVIKVDNKEKVKGKLPILSNPDVISESQSTKISIRGESQCPNNATQSAVSSNTRGSSRSIEETVSSKQVMYDPSDTEKDAINNSNEPKCDQIVILSDDDDANSDLEIVSETIQPTKPSTKSTAFLDMVRKARGDKSTPTSPIVRIRDTSISQAFLRVITSSREQSKSNFSGQRISISSVMRSQMKSGPDRDVETIEIISDDDEEKAHSSRVDNQGESTNSNKCSKKRPSSDDQSFVQDTVSRQIKKPRT